MPLDVHAARGSGDTSRSFSLPLALYLFSSPLLRPSRSSYTARTSPPPRPPVSVRLSTLVLVALSLFHSPPTVILDPRRAPADVLSLFLPPPSVSPCVSDRCAREAAGIDERVALSAASHICRYAARMAPLYDSWAQVHLGTRNCFEYEKGRARGKGDVSDNLRQSVKNLKNEKKLNITFVKKF